MTSHKRSSLLARNLENQFFSLLCCDLPDEVPLFRSTTPSTTSLSLVVVAMVAGPSVSPKSVREREREPS